MNSPYLAFHKEHAIISVIVAVVGYTLWRRIGTDSPARRYHGRYVLVWTVAGFVFGGTIGPYLFHPDLPFGAIGLTGFCLLAGWMVGMVHGLLMLSYQKRIASGTKPTPEPDEELQQ